MIFRINRHQWFRLPIFVFAILVIACANEKLFDYNETDAENDSTFSGENNRFTDELRNLLRRRGIRILPDSWNFGFRGPFNS